MVSWIGQRAVAVGNQLGHCSLVTFDATQRILGEFDPTSDLLKFFLRASEVADGAFHCGAIRALSPIINAARDITGAISARCIMGTMWGIASGNAGWEHPMGVQGVDASHDRPRVNMYTLGRSLCDAVGDVCSTLEWLVTIGALSDIVARLSVNIRVFGRTFGFNALGTAGSVGGVAGALFAIGEDVRQILWGGRLSQDGRTLSSGLKASTGLDLAYRVATIAGIVLTHMAAPTMLVIGISFLGIGCILSLAKFLAEKNEAAQEAHDGSGPQAQSRGPKWLGEIPMRDRPLPSLLSISPT